MAAGMGVAEGTKLALQGFVESLAPLQVGTGLAEHQLLVSQLGFDQIVPAAPNQHDAGKEQTEQRGSASSRHGRGPSTAPRDC